MAIIGTLFKLTAYSETIGPSNVLSTTVGQTQQSSLILSCSSPAGNCFLPLTADFNATGSDSREKNCCVRHLKMLPCLNFCLPTPAVLLLFYIWLRVRSVTGTVNIIEIQTVEWKELSLAIFPSQNGSILPRCNMSSR